jgi:cephalosporin-C deacetylase-like acetyl esterase
MKRAVDYLATRPDLVDMDRVVAKGGSQGGALALVTAALDDRVALCLSDSPSNLQMHELILNYSGFGPSIGNVPEGQTVEDLITTLSYYDAVNMCPWIEAPTVIGLSVGDLTVHSMGGLAAYKNLTSLPPEEKWFFPGPTHFHANSPEGGAKMKALLQEVREGKLTR